MQKRPGRSIRQVGILFTTWNIQLIFASFQIFCIHIVLFRSISVFLGFLLFLFSYVRVSISSLKEMSYRLGNVLAYLRGLLSCSYTGSCLLVAGNRIPVANFSTNH